MVQFSLTSSHVPDQYLFEAVNSSTHRAITDNLDDLNLEFKEIRGSANTVDLPHKIVEYIIEKRSENSQISQNISALIE